MLQLDYNKLMTSLLQQGVAVNVKAIGISMFPLLWPGMELRITKATDIKKNDIVVFKRDDGKWIGHRVIATTELIECRGDSCINADKPVPLSNIIGKVTHFTICGITVPLNNCIANLYGQLTIAMYPLSARINNMIARMAMKIKQTLS